MKTPTMDFAGTRETLREQLEEAEALAEKLDAEIGALALAVVLGEAPERDLAGARESRANAAAKVAEIGGALVALDAREEAAAQADADRQRQADEKRLAELQRTCNAAGVKVIDLATQLGVVLAEGHAAAQEADMLGRRLEVNTITIQGWTLTAHKVISGRIGSGGGFLPGEQAAAELALTGQQ